MVDGKKLKVLIYISRLMLLLDRCVSGRGPIVFSCRPSYLPVAGDVESMPAVVGDSGRRRQPQG